MPPTANSCKHRPTTLSRAVSWGVPLQLRNTERTDPWGENDENVLGFAPAVTTAAAVGASDAVC